MSKGKGRYVVIVRKAGRIIEKMKYEDYFAAMEAADKLESRYDRDPYTVEFQDTDPFSHE
jgi:hypothetical protein